MSDPRKTQEQFGLSGLRFQAVRPDVWKEELTTDPDLAGRSSEMAPFLLCSLSLPPVKFFWLRRVRGLGLRELAVFL